MKKSKSSSILKEKLASLINSIKITNDTNNTNNNNNNIALKLDALRQLKHRLFSQDTLLLSEFLPSLFDLLADEFSPVRKAVIEIVGGIGLRHLEFLPDIVPVLINTLEDATPAVARQAIICGIDLFRSTLENIVIQGLFSSELDSDLESAWTWMLQFKDQIYSIAFRPGSGGVRLLSLKFVEAVILLYTPDPKGSLEPPNPHEGNSVEFNVSCIRGGHPVLNMGDLSIEASQKLALLLDHLRFPTVKSLSCSVVIVLINSLSTIAKKRPTYYGRILPVLLALDPPTSVIKGVHVTAAHNALKNAFESCLECTHSSAAPWRDRLVGALKDIEQARHQKINESAEGGKVDLLTIKEESESFGPVQSDSGKKRSDAEHRNNLADVTSSKRIKHTPNVSEESSKSQDDGSSTGQTTSKRDVDNGPVQQLIAMFGVLVAQGEKAIVSLEILISSISADLLSEVVIANAHNLPPNCSNGDELIESMSIIGSDTQSKYPPSFLANVLSLSSTFPPVVASLLPSEPEEPQGEEFHVSSLTDNTIFSMDITHEAEDELPATILQPPSDVVWPEVEMGVLASSSTIQDLDPIEGSIPGLESSDCQPGFSEPLPSPLLLSTMLEDNIQAQVAINLDVKPLLDVVFPSISTEVPSISMEKSEELSLKTAIIDSNTDVSSTAGFPGPVVLPKMLAPVINLADEEKDDLQKMAFTRIIEAYKQIDASGGSEVRFSLLASLGVDLPLDLDLWKLLKEHILSDYVIHEGHELTLRVLYRLSAEAEQHDFFSSTNAVSVYEMFLLTVAETLRDSFPPSDKSLSRLLMEATHLPKSVLKLLEGLCLPGNSDKSDESKSGDRVHQGLSIVWNLILHRSLIREDCLKIALQSAVHNLEEVRTKAIRLVANRLYPLSYLAQQIEDFAKNTLLSGINGDFAENPEADGSITELQKESDLEKAPNENQSEANQLSSESVSIQEAKRCLSLYFALCTKKHSLFRQIFVIYKDASKAVIEAVQQHIPILVRTMGSSPDLLEIISDPPSGSENLLLKVLHTLIDGTVPSQELIFTVRKLYDSKLKNVDILISVLPFLQRDEVILSHFPLKFVPEIAFRQPQMFYFSNLHILPLPILVPGQSLGSSRSGPVLTPAEVLIAIHGIDPDRDGIPLKKVTDACNACFEQRQIFTQQVIAKVLNQLVEQIPLPLLFMRTVLQAIGAFPALVDFIMEILSRLVSKQIWKYPKLWVGFLKCAQLTKPQSFNVLLQLPPQQLENALNRSAALKAPLIAHASQPNIRSSLPRFI
ncbi:hypothetical protein ACFE04_030925 [Oxalis oulophora]